jgi:hypothetical protein
MATKHVKSGWQFWMKGDKGPRQITVAESDFDRAEALVKKATGSDTTISYQEMDGSLLAFLTMETGGVIEWVPLSASDKIRPGGTTRGGAYDTHPT